MWLPTHALLSRMPQALGKLGRAKVRVVLTIDPREEAMVVANLQSRKFYGVRVYLGVRSLRFPMRTSARIAASLSHHSVLPAKLIRMGRSITLTPSARPRSRRLHA